MPPDVDLVTGTSWVSVLVPAPTALLVLAFGVASIVAGGYARWRARAVARWRRTRGEVVGSRVHFSYVAAPEVSTTGAALAVTYRYRAGGASYEGETLAFRPHSVAGDDAAARALAASHPPGTGVPVYYDSADPSRSTLEPPDPVDAGAAALAFGALAVALAAWALLAAW